MTLIGITSQLSIQPARCPLQQFRSASADIHRDGVHATLRRGVKRNRHALKTRAIHLDWAARLLPQLPDRGRLFACLLERQREGQHAVWALVRQAAGEGEPGGESRGPCEVQFKRFRLQDNRHSFAVPSLIDDPTCIHHLMEHIGHSSVKTTEGNARFLRGEGAQRRDSRDPTLFGSQPPGP